MLASDCQPGNIGRGLKDNRTTTKTWRQGRCSIGSVDRMLSFSPVLDRLCEGTVCCSLRSGGQVASALASLSPTFVIKQDVVSTEIRTINIRQALILLTNAICTFLQLLPLGQEIAPTTNSLPLHSATRAPFSVHLFFA
jgi:hypothetical protein